MAMTTQQQFHDRKKPQADRIIAKFGGARSMARILAEIDPSFSKNPSSIYRWTYPKEKGGTGGVIPPRVMGIIAKAARYHGIFLTGDDFYPGSV